MMEERVSEFHNTLMEITQIEKQRGKEENKRTETQCPLRKYPNI